MTKLIVRASQIGAAVSALLLPAAARAQLTIDPSYAGTFNLGSGSPVSIVIGIVNWALGLLALVAVILVLIGGFMWMTAAGNEEKVDKAKKILSAAIIGLVIILAAWGITIYAINVLGTATGSV